MRTNLRRGGRTLPATATEPISQKYRLKKACMEKFGKSLMMRYLHAEAHGAYTMGMSQHVEVSRMLNTIRYHQQCSPGTIKMLELL